MDFLKRIEESFIVPVAVFPDAHQALPTAEALLNGGAKVLEITLRTPAALESIRTVSREAPGLSVGAGTVLTRKQAQEAVQCGAQFIVSPGMDEETVSWCMQNNIPVIPGAVTPTEIMAALKWGLHTVKFFPADAFGGLRTLKSLHAPFQNVKFIPTGGIDDHNISEYAKAQEYILAVGGSWVCPKEEIAARQFGRITERFRAAKKAAGR